MITFLTPTALPIEAATTMGVSVKGADDAIGKFGTGLKYAIAGILRLGGNITIWIDGDRYDFTAETSNIRGRDFRIVHCNGSPCGFTTDLGKHWEPWQLFRELASNTKDESGTWTRDQVGPSSARTVMAVECREIEESERNEQVFLCDREALVESTCGATIYAGPSRHYYFRGIRAGSFDRVAPVTVDVSSGQLSEDRLLDRSTVQREMAWAFRTATKWDHDLILSILPQQQAGDFWVDEIPGYWLHDADLPTNLIEFIADRHKFVGHPAFRDVLARYQRKSGIGKWREIERTPRHDALIASGEALCAAIGVDVIPREKVHFTADLADEQLAVTCMDTRDVWFSTKLALLGRDEFLSGYLEEAIHAMTGARDCTREFQNALLSIIVATNEHAIRSRS